jgi:phosphoribosyl-ATP pyrophosphohydrolase
MLIPSIDLMAGKAVQLIGGKEKVLEVEDVMRLARSFRVYGEIAVIDLDAAMGRGDNLELIKQICKEVRCRVGGGIRDRKKAEELLRAGARKLIIGTAADESFLSQFPKDMVMVAVDHWDGTLLSHGWLKDEKESPLDRMRRLAPYCCGFLVTQVHREGRMLGVDFEAARALRERVPNEIVYAGGVTSAEEVAKLDKLGLDAQVGMALYTGRLDPSEAFTACMDFSKANGMLASVVQDQAGRLRMVAWQTPESLKKALTTRQGAFYSRSRKSLWVKGESSGHTQELLFACPDCDRDVVRFVVKQTGPSCHTGMDTCFGPAEFRLEDLEQIILSRKNKLPADSYTARLLREPALLEEKLCEETAEVIAAKDRPDDLVWECADLTYFLMVQMAAGGVTLSQVLNELARRRK